MTKKILKERLKQYAIQTAFFVLKLPYNIVNKNYSDQLNRSALRGKSATVFLNKLKIVKEELDETLFFSELIEGLNPSFKKDIQPLYKEGNELLSINVASIITLRNRQMPNIS